MIVGCSTASVDSGPVPTVTTAQWMVVGSYQDPRDPVNGVSFDFSLDGRYVMKLGSSCTGGPIACVQGGTFALDVPDGKLRLSPDSGGTEVLEFTLPAASGAPSTSAASLAYATGSLQIADDPLAGDAGSDAGTSSTSGCIDPSDPSIASEPIRIADSPILSGGALVGDAGPLLAPDAGGALVCQKQISLFTLGPVGDGGLLIASATPQQAINYNLPGTCGGAVGPNCSLANSIGGVHTGFPVGSTCDKVAGTTDQVECDVSIGSLAHDSCCGHTLTASIAAVLAPRRRIAPTPGTARRATTSRGISGANDSPQGRSRRPDGAPSRARTVPLPTGCPG